MGGGDPKYFGTKVKPENFPFSQILKFYVSF